MLSAVPNADPPTGGTMPISELLSAATSETGTVTAQAAAAPAGDLVIERLDYTGDLGSAIPCFSSADA
ncbi:hypothetical protein SAMN05421773_11280 [Streptomyces aidingensis]|uniref:Uncharacterized protein n=2 Tax=Streptomyces aidingensis TaxID=910347 RepID=A0A1I1R9N6_9ACTN|nr:hypothetical protein SAMN05421773_11280 [Streptomyces aidingensis]